MKSLLDDPLFLAMIEAQNRAQAKHQQAVRLNFSRFRVIFDDAAQCYARGSFDGSMKRILSFVIDWYEPYTDDAERYGYKYACGIEFSRRKQAGLAVQKNLDRTRPVPPISVYEQET